MFGVIHQGTISHTESINLIHNVDGLGQKRRNSIANALELRLFCTDPSMCIQSLHLENYYYISQEPIS